MAHTTPQTGYAPVNGLQLYYEIRGTGQPLVVLHGAFMTIELLGDLVPGLARSRQVIAVELQGHGHTADIDRPLTYEQLAGDTAALLRHLGLGTADIYGYSLGGGVALQVALRHPELVRKLVLVSASYTSEGLYPEVRAGIEQITPALFDGTPWRVAYDRTAPHPKAFPTLVAKKIELDRTPFAWSAAAIAALTAPTLIIIGDADGTRPEHAVALFRLRGGGVFGDVAGLPAAQLAVLPGTTHVGMLDRAAWLLMLIADADPAVPRRAGHVSGQSGRDGGYPAPRSGMRRGHLVTEGDQHHSRGRAGFDVRAAEYAEASADAWTRVLGFIAAHSDS